jgi:ABC-type sugar transport system ATPase subunit
VPKPSPIRSIAAGLGFLTEDRKGEGLFMLLDLAANVTAPVLETVGESIWLDRGAEKDIAQKQIRDYAIAATGPQASVANLSGGNQQKVLLGRWVISSRGPPSSSTSRPVGSTSGRRSRSTGSFASLRGGALRSS